MKSLFYNNSIGANLDVVTRYDNIVAGGDGEGGIVEGGGYTHVSGSAVQPFVEGMIEANNQKDAAGDEVEDTDSSESGSVDATENSGGGGDGKKGYYGDPLFVTKYYNGDPDKPVKTMTVSQANKWYNIGGGEGVYIDFTTIVLPSWLTVEWIKENSTEEDSGIPVVYVRFDHPSGFVNPNQALVYGGIRIALIDENTVWAYPDRYDFDQGEQKGAGLGRDLATMIGGGVAGFGYTNRPQGFDIYFIGYQTIPQK